MFLTFPYQELNSVNSVNSVDTQVFCPKPLLVLLVGILENSTSVSQL